MDAKGLSSDEVSALLLEFAEFVTGVADGTLGRS